MKFWDASALVPLCVEQLESAAVKALIEDDGGPVVWWGSIIECWSAFARLRRRLCSTRITRTQRAHGFHTLQEAWIEILPSEDVKAHAGRLMRHHQLRCLHMPRQALEAAAPKSLRKVEPRAGLIERLDPKPAPAALAFAFIRDERGLLEHLEVA